MSTHVPDCRRGFFRLFVLGVLFLSAGCTAAPAPAATAPPALPVESSPPPAAVTAPLQPASVPELAGYAFPDSIDPGAHYLFYLHGRIIEEQGIHAVSPDFGAYEYEAILDKLQGYGFVVIGEVRTQNADSLAYAQKVKNQVRQLLDAGVPPENITVVGASKGAGMAALVSHILGNEKVNFVLMAICSPEMTAEWQQNKYYLVGNVLSLYDSADTLAGSCRELFQASEGHGLGRHHEIVLHVGTGHGILYKPLDAWILPVVEWAGQP